MFIFFYIFDRLKNFMKKISAVIITLNEEEKIGQCIDSLKDVADDIVVVDSFSTDNTKAICKSKGIRVFEHVFENYIKQKNYALTCAINDMVLSLDADELLSDELKKAILLEKQNGLPYTGYTMNRLTFFKGKGIKHSGWYPDKKLRLFDRRKGKWQGLNPHDEFKFLNTHKIKHLSGDILHYSFDTEEEYIKQMKNFAQLSAKAYFAKGKKASLWKLIINPWFRFARDYFLKGGIFHGVLGLKICILNARSTKLKYNTLKALYKYHN